MDTDQGDQQTAKDDYYNFSYSSQIDFIISRYPLLRSYLMYKEHKDLIDTYLKEDHVKELEQILVDRFIPIQTIDVDYRSKNIQEKFESFFKFSLMLHQFIDNADISKLEDEVTKWVSENFDVDALTYEDIDRLTKSIKELLVEV
jgi:hypothetical protein